MKRLSKETFNTSPKIGSQFSWQIFSRASRLVCFVVVLLYVSLMPLKEVVESSSLPDETLHSKSSPAEQQKMTVNGFPKEEDHLRRWAWNHATPALHGKHTCTSRNVPALSEEWQLRAPHFVILGTQKGRTQALQTYLIRHP